MALYSAVPAPRLAYDIDGTKVVQVNISTGAITELTTTQKQTLNNEGTDTLSYAVNSYIAFLFPEQLTISAYTTIIQPQSATTLEIGAFEYSNNTTNGLDGTWTSKEATFTNNNTAVTNPTYRTSIHSLTGTINATAVRFRARSYVTTTTYTTFFNLINLFGTPVSSSSLDFWHPTNNAAVSASYFDFQDVAQGSNNVIQFRLKNSNGSLTANSVNISFSFLTEQTPTLASQYSLSLDGTTYSTSVTLASSISPGSISPIIYLKRNTSASAGLGLHAGRIHSVVGSWT